MLQEQASSGNMYHLSIYCIIYTILLTIERKCGACKKLVQDGEAGGALHTKNTFQWLCRWEIFIILSENFTTCQIMRFFNSLDQLNWVNYG